MPMPSKSTNISVLRLIHVLQLEFYKRLSEKAWCREKQRLWKVRQRMFQMTSTILNCYIAIVARPASSVGRA